MTHTPRNATPEELAAAREPTGPEPVGVWHLLLGKLDKDPLERWQRIMREHGDVARYRFGFDTNYFVSSAEGVRRVLQDNVGNYTKDHPAYGMLARLVGNGLLTSQGAFWLRQRRLAQPAFHRQALMGMAERMRTLALETAERWTGLAQAGEEVLMLEEMSRVTLRIVVDALFGTVLPAKTELISHCWDVLNRQMVDRYDRMRLLPPILPTRDDREFRQARRTMFKVVADIIQLKRQQGPQDDLLSLLMAATDEDSGERMTDTQLRDEMVTLLLAGHETTAVTLSWTWALLAQHPEARKQLDQELSDVLAGEPPTVEQLPRLRYTRAVIDEAMRLYPPAYIFFRRAVGDDVVAGHRIRRGGVVVISPVVLHRHPAYWPRPDDFVPERWLEPEAETQRPPFAFMPFSGGPRKCIGNNFALMEATLILATLAARFQPKLTEGRLPEPEYLITLRPAKGLPMRIEQAAPRQAARDLSA